MFSWSPGLRAGHLISLVLLLFPMPAAYADGDYEMGVRLFNARNYRSACGYFERSVKNNPSDINAMYYDALNFQYMGDYVRAKNLYHRILSQAPNAQAADLARQALSRIEPGFGRSLAGGSSSGAGNSSLDTAPDESRIRFSPRGDNELIVNGEVNNRSIEMIYDTGAEGCVFGKNNLQQLGLNPPTGPATGKSFGVGSNGAVPTWNMNVDLKVGQIARRNFPIMVQDNMQEPLLGETFFNNYEYTIDNGAHTILFRKKGAAGQSGSSAYDVPFVRQGNELLVNVQINGKACQMFFDTGASGVSFTKDQLKSIGLSVPEDAEDTKNAGVGGETTGHAFAVQRMVLGPVDKSNVQVTCVDEAAMPHPLLGQNFYNDWQYTIDNSKHVIHFVRR